MCPLCIRKITHYSRERKMSEVLPYKDAKRPVKERVDDLLSRMTLEEKVGQLMQLDGRKEAMENLSSRHPGSYLQIINEQCAELQREALKSRLGIPLLFGIDAIHGHSFWPGASIFPTQLAMASSFNPEVAEEAGRVTAREMSYTGVHWAFSPVACLARDLRWGRVGETFGEDPHLIGVLAAAMVRGYQGDDLADRLSVLACVKHYTGYGETHGGRDATEADHSRRKLRTYFLPPFADAMKSCPATVMTGYQAIDGVPCTINKWLMTDVLRGELGFDGFVVTDWNNVGHMLNLQKVRATVKEAAADAIDAGNDMLMAAPTACEGAIEAVKSGRLSESVVDLACRRVLTIKMRMGLFEDPRLPDMKKAAELVAAPEHRAALLKSARQSIVLLKNENDMLPLKASKLKRVAVIGPLADDPLQQLGDWTLGTGQAGLEGNHPREATVTLRDGLLRRLGDDVELTYARGCEVTSDDTSEFEEAIEAAARADVAIVAVGEHQDFRGEVKSTATLELMGPQQELLESIAATGTPMVVVLMNSKPLAVPWIADHAAAVIEAWNPGMEGGTALAEILFGDINPSGKLPISIPRHVGQLPVWYSQVRGQHGKRYADMTQEPLWPFGFGLSYTTYEYANLAVEKAEISAGESIRVSVDVTNSGKVAGTEIVQLYVSDLVTSATWVDRLLRDFRRVELAAGETKSVKFELPHEALEIVDAECRRVVEPGEFEILVGGSSRDADLQRVTVTVKE